MTYRERVSPAQIRPQPTWTASPADLSFSRPAPIGSAEWKVHPQQLDYDAGVTGADVGNGPTITPLVFAAKIPA